ncbi:MAG: VWA domain-containing protein [Gammaproteobacteria bacterium]|nr:VWA domain-containing protein [Gammaproteobacteria bacterium]
MIQFDWPWALLCLPLPLILRFILPAANTVQDAALRVPFIEDFAADTSLDKTRKLNRWLLMLASIAWILLVLAASRPQWLGDRLDIPVSGRDLMLAVDLSGSMAEEDFAIGNQTINRLQAVKLVAGEFIKRREGDRLGLILFGERAYLQTPLTFDITTVNTLLQESLIGIAGKATAIGDAIGLGIKRLQNLEVNSRVLILLTDGRNTAGEVEPIKAAEIAAEQGLKIYTIGIGAEMVERGGFFFNRQVKNREIDEKTLTAIAEQTGGKYFRARDTEELNKIYSLLDELEPVEQESQSFRPIMALYFWPLGFALVIVFFISVLKATGLSR